MTAAARHAIAAATRARPALRVAGWLAAVAGLAVVGHRMWRDGAPALPGVVHPWAVAAAVALLAAVLAAGVLAWGAVLARCGGAEGAARPASAALFRVWAPSTIARYLPGGVWQLAVVAALARPAAVAPARLVTSLLLHTAFSLAGAALVAAVALARAGAVSTPLASALAVGAAAGVHPAVLRRAAAAAGRLGRVPSLDWHGTWRDAARLLALHAINWVGVGAAFALLAHGASGAPLAELPRLTGALTAAFLVGYAAVIVPAGLGVREATLAALLVPIVGGAAAPLAVAARLWMVAGELALALAVLAAAGLASRAGRAAPLARSVSHGD